MKIHSIEILVKETNINFHNWYTTAEGFHHPIFKKYVGGILPNWVIKIENDSGQWGVIWEEWEKIGSLFAQNFNHGKIDIFEVEKDHYKVGGTIKKIVKDILTTDLKKATTSKLLAWLKVMWLNYHFLNGVGYVAVASDFGHNFLTNKTTEILTKKNLKQENLNKILSLLMSPDKQTLFWQEHLALLKLCKKYKILSRIVSSKEFKAHQQKWFWLNYGYQGPIWACRQIPPFIHLKSNNICATMRV